MQPQQQAGGESVDTSVGWEIIKTTKKDEYYFRWRHILIILALAQSFLAAGIFYGWPSLYTMLLEEGIYNDQCPKPGVICQKQTLKLGFIYTIGGCANLAAQLLWGWILDQNGPKVCSFLSVLTVCIGVILLGITDSEFDVLMYGMVMIAAGGPGASIACFHLSNLFPENKNSVLSSFSGAFQLGFMVFMIFRMVSQTLGRFYVCMIYAFLLMVIIVLGLLMWPDRSLTAPREEDADSKSKRVFTNSPSFIRINQYADGNSNMLNRKIGPFGDPSLGNVAGDNQNLSRSASLVDSPAQPTPPNYVRATNLYRVDSDIMRMSSIATPTVRRQIKRVKPLLWKQLLSWPFFCLCLWMSASLFWLNFYIGNVADQMFQQSDGDRIQAHQYTDYFTTILPLGAAAIPFYGWSTDRYGLPFAVGCSTVFGIVFTTMCLTHDLQLQLGTFVSYSLYRTFVFATFFSLVAKEFGYSSFGVISGLILFISGIACLFQYPVREYGVPDENFNIVNVVQLVTIWSTGILFAIYICVHFKDSKPAAAKRNSLANRVNRVSSYGSFNNDNNNNRANPVATVAP